MKKNLFYFLLCFVINFTALGQASGVKKCKTCGNPIKECQYKGKHLDRTNVTASFQSPNEAQKYLAKARQYYDNKNYCNALSELNNIDERYHDGEYWNLKGDCEYYHINSMTSNYWYTLYIRAAENGSTSAKNKVLSDIRHSSWFGSIGVDSNSSASVILYDRAYHEKDMNEKIRWYKIAASKGYLYAAFNLGRIYEVGSNGVPINYEEAVKYYKMSETLDESKLHLAWLYRHGLGVEVNLTKSFELYSSMAKSNVIAMYNVGACYEGGLGTNLDLKEALVYYREVLDMSECNWGSKRCIELAAERYYVLTIDKGLLDSKPPTGNYYFNLRKAYVKRKITQQFWRKAAELGVDCGEYQADIGNCYKEENNYTEALKWYRLGAGNQNGRACWCLGDF